PCDIATRPRQAGDEPASNRIASSSEDNWEDPGCLLGGKGSGCAHGHDDINFERNQFGRKSGEPLELPLGISVFNDDVATLDVAEVTQSLTEGLAQVGARSQVGRQVAYSSGRGGLLGAGGPRAEESTEEKGDAEGKPQPSHLDSGPSNSRRRRVRIGPTSLWSRPRSLTFAVTGRGERMRASGPVSCGVSQPAHFVGSQPRPIC